MFWGRYEVSQNICRWQSHIYCIVKGWTPRMEYYLGCQYWKVHFKPLLMENQNKSFFFFFSFKKDLNCVLVCVCIFEWGQERASQTSKSWTLDCYEPTHMSGRNLTGVLSEQWLSLSCWAFSTALLWSSKSFCLPA